jgi:outer membrane protein TolC
VLIVLLALPASARVLSFRQIVNTALANHAIPPTANEAANALELPPARLMPIIRAETAITRGSNADIFTTNIFRADAFTTLVSVDYPLLDGGARDAQVREAKLDAAAFRARIATAADAVFREAVEATAQLYAAQEKLKVLHGGLERAIALRDRAKLLVTTHEISNTIAAQWEDEALIAESQILDLDLQRLEAETHIKQLMGDTSQESIEVSLGSSDPRVPRSDRGTEDLNVARKKLALEEAQASALPQLMMSAFGGVASIDAGPQYGLYGLRFSLTLPALDAAAKRRIAEARLDAEEAAIERELSQQLEKRQASTLALNVAATQKRIALLQQAVDIARQREQSVVRLAFAGARSENAVAEAAFDRTRRESDLISARVDLWKYTQLLEHRR